MKTIKIKILILLFLVCNVSVYTQNSLTSTADVTNSIAILTSSDYNNYYGTALLLNNELNNEKKYVLIFTRYSLPNNVVFHWGANEPNKMGKYTTTGFRELVPLGNLGPFLAEIEDNQFDNFDDFTPYYLGWNSFENKELVGEKCTEIYNSGNGWITTTFPNNLYKSPATDYSDPKNFWALEIQRENSGQAYRTGFPLLDANNRLIGLFYDVWDTTTGPSVRSSSDFKRFLYLRFDLLWENGLSGYLDPNGTSSGFNDGMKGSPKDILIINQDITSSRNMYGCDVTMQNVTISNNAIVNINSKTTHIKSYFKAETGTKMRIKAENNCPESFNLRSLANTEIEESKILEKEFIGITVKLTPNPTIGILNFSCTDYDAVGAINIYNSSGVLVYTNTELRDGNTIDLTSHAKDLYLARIEVNGEIVTTKIILK